MDKKVNVKTESSIKMQKEYICEGNVILIVERTLKACHKVRNQKGKSHRLNNIRF